MKIALCLSGELRTFNHCGNQIRHHLINKYNIENVFCHFWWDGKKLPNTKMKYWDETRLDTGDYSGWSKRGINQIRHHDLDDFDGDPVKTLVNMYPISGLSFTPPFWKAWGRDPGPKDEAEYNEWMSYLRSYGKWAGQPNPENKDLPDNMREWFHDYNRAIFYSQSAAAALKRAHEREFGKFDLVIRTRYDIGFNGETPTLQELEKFFADPNNLMMRENSGISYDNIYIYRTETHDSFTTGIYENLDKVREVFQKRPQTCGTPESYQHAWGIMNYGRNAGEPLYYSGSGMDLSSLFFNWGLEIIRHPSQVVELDKRIMEQ